MQKNFFFLSPIEVVKVTSGNLEEVAEWCGGKVAETESRRNPGRMDKYVWVPTPKDSKISWAFPGMFVTKRVVVTMKDELRETFAVYRRDYFEKNYFESPKEAADATWERQLEEKSKPAKRPEVVVATNVGEILSEAMGGGVVITTNEGVKVEVPAEIVAQAAKVNEEVSIEDAKPVEVTTVVNGVELDKPTPKAVAKKKVAKKVAEVAITG